MNKLQVLKSIMGEEIYESLSKALIKLNTKSVVDLEELHSALKSVPKSIIAFLMRELKDMEKDQTKEIKMPWAENAEMTVTKLDQDVYKGRIVRDSKIVHEFDLTAIPQLAAHLMSVFEIYDEPDEEPKQEAAKPDDSQDIRNQLQALEGKINALMMVIASQSSTSMQKSEEPNLKKKFIDSVKKYSLTKAGLAPKMPSPPKAGSNVGGKNGITEAGIHGDKTAHTDLSTKPITAENNPYLKAPKPAATSAPKASTKPPKATTPTPKPLAQSEKVLTFKKSELDGPCIDCGQVVSDCACFRALSKPEIKKSDSKSVTFKFNGDWDTESITALYKSIKRTKD